MDDLAARLEALHTHSHQLSVRDAELREEGRKLIKHLRRLCHDLQLLHREVGLLPRAAPGESQPPASDRDPGGTDATPDPSSPPE